MIAGQTQFLDMYRSSLRTMNDVMKASLETTERLHNQQLQQVRSALEENMRSTSQLGEVRSIDELMDLQRRLAGVQLQRTMEFWGSMWRTASENQMSVISQLQSATARAAEDATRFSTAQQQSNAVSVREASAAIKEAAQQQERQHQQQHRRAG